MAFSEKVTIFGSSSSSKCFEKDVDNLMPFSKCNSEWNSLSDGFVKHSSHPMITQNSVMGVTFDGGVMLCADTLASFGKMKRFYDKQRIFKVNDQIILGAGGDLADFQHICQLIEQQVINENCLDDGFHLKPKSLYSWLTRVLYNRRSKMDPLWNTFVIAGLQDDKPYLGTVDKLGAAYECASIASGFGSYVALPVLREAVEKNPKLSKEEALDLLKHCIRLLYYFDSMSLPKFTLGIVTKEGVSIEGPVIVDSNWDNAVLDIERKKFHPFDRTRHTSTGDQ